ncbi:chlorophyll(ide) b reductase NOL, chloroplastic isoform X4 [Vitis vinifera]|uniref:chlorophyll(ide) b reductase NOL, chloroplastic isoform X4 n=1 Tax=Vitis vinifera TaxID=29760 RepID=UPI0008FEBE5A|nr:chlorophyll(ide) b reductase NOL, chloroplastic isoform X4 [Vitis vinifera]|eukprot:XP_019076852.1 PREDICTED: chlorophyll(ide) b reductase NOL, chloroplastic isoform X4 [Vitis vinifera]
MAITASVSFLSPSPSRLFCLQNHNPLSQPLFSLPFHSHAFLTFASPQKRLKPTAIPKNITPSAQASNDSAPMLPPYNVLITGSTKGIGFALAREFLKAGDNVIISSRSGSNAYSYKPLAEASDEDLIEVVTTNTLGLMICCREAIKMMLNQPQGGHIFNIDGAGSDGRPTPRFAAYGATKRSVVHLTKSLQAELQMQDVKNVVVHNLSPGMVTTDLLMSGATTKQAKFFINVLAEPAEVVAEYLVPNIRSIPVNGSTKPTYIRFLTGLKAYSQIFSRFAFGARRNRYLLED